MMEHLPKKTRQIIAVLIDPNQPSKISYSDALDHLASCPMCQGRVNHLALTGQEWQQPMAELRQRLVSQGVWRLSS